MDAAGLLLGVVALAPKAMPWLGREHTMALAARSRPCLLLAGGLLYRRRRRRAWRRRAAGGDAGVRQLKERLRRRLAEPAETFANAAVPGPTSAPARRSRPTSRRQRRACCPRPAGGAAPPSISCAAASAAIPPTAIRPTAGPTAPAAAPRPRMAPARRAGTARRYPRRAGGLCQGRRPRRRRSRSADAARRPPSARRSPEAAESTFRRQLDLADGKDGGEAIRYRAGAMLGDVLHRQGRARRGAGGLRGGPARRCWRSASASPPARAGGAMRRSLHDRIGDVRLGDGQIDLALGELPEEPGDRRGAGPGRGRQPGPAARPLGGPRPRRRGPGAEDRPRRRPRELPPRPGHRRGPGGAGAGPRATGAGTSPPASTASAICWRPAASRTRPCRPGAARSTSPRRWLARDPLRLDWQRDLAVTCHKIGLLEARCGHEAEAREALEQGRAIVARLAHIARYQAQWQADLAKFNAALRTLGP